MWGNVDCRAFGPCQNIETPVTPFVYEFCSHLASHLCIRVMLRQTLSLRVRVVAKVKQVVRGTALVLLARIKVVPLRN